MNNSSLDEIVDLPMNTFASTNTRIKQEPMARNAMLDNNHGLEASTTHQMDLHNDAIEYIPNPLDDANIQGTFPPFSIEKRYIHCFCLV